jgi:hypothetical protein
MNRMFWKELLWEALFGSFSTVGEKGTIAVPGGSPTLTPIPGLLLAPNGVAAVPVFPAVPKRPPLPPPPNADVPVPKPVVAGLFPPKRDVLPPPKGVVVLVLVPKPPPPNPEPPVVAVVEPNRDGALVVVAGVPNAGLLPNAPEPNPPDVFEPKAPPPPPPKRPPPAAGVVVEPKAVEPVDPKPASASIVVSIVFAATKGLYSVTATSAMDGI